MSFAEIPLLPAPGKALEVPALDAALRQSPRHTVYAFQTGLRLGDRLQ